MTLPLESEDRSTPPSASPVEQRLVKPQPMAARGASAKAEAARVRLAAWRARHQWADRQLHPYSIGRDEAWAMLCDSDVPLPEDRSELALDIGHARKLLFVCAAEPSVLASGSIPELIEQAEAWADEHIPRHSARQALDLARQIRHEAHINRARLRPSERKVENSNAAMPVFEASYLTMLAAALRGAASEERMLWDISLARGWALIHGWWIMEGHATLWLDKKASEEGSWFAEFRRKHEKR